MWLRNTVLAQIIAYLTELKDQPAAAASSEETVEHGCSMANLVVSELLCFLRCKMASVPAQNLIQVCKAFFSDEEIAKAKERLFESEVEWTSVGVRNIKRKTTTKASKASLDLEDMMKAL